MSFEVCFACGVHATERDQSIQCDHDKYYYDWKKDIPRKLDAVTPRNNEEVASSV